VLAIVILAVIIISNPGNQIAVLPTATTPATSTNTAAPTDTPTPTFTPSRTPTPTQTLSAAQMTEIMGELVVNLATQDVETRNAEVAATSALWTPTETPNLILTARALQTATEMTAIAAATQAVYAA